MQSENPEGFGSHLNAGRCQDVIQLANGRSLGNLCFENLGAAVDLDKKERG